MNAQITMPIMPYQPTSNRASYDPRAVRLFNHSRRNPQPNVFQKMLGWQSQPIEELDNVKASNRYHLGSQSIRIDEIHGTLDRAGDFDYDFRPLKESDKDRWCKVATAMINGIDLPPIEVVKFGDAFYVKDGHHRISVARALGFMYLDAIVEVWG